MAVLIPRNLRASLLPPHSVSPYVHKVALHFLLCFTALRGGAQQRVVQYKPFIDERPWHYGFQIGLHEPRAETPQQRLHQRGRRRTMGGRERQTELRFLGRCLGRMESSRNLAFRVTPTLHFGSKHLTFRNMATKQELTQDMKTTYIAVPALVKVAGPRYNNFRPYVVGGVDMMYDLTSSKGSYIRTRPLQPSSKWVSVATFTCLSSS